MKPKLKFINYSSVDFFKLEDEIFLGYYNYRDQFGRVIVYEKDFSENRVRLHRIDGDIM